MTAFEIAKLMNKNILLLKSNIVKLRNKVNMVK